MSNVSNVQFYPMAELMNIELTTRCPLNCPQCYCELNTGKDIDADIAVEYIRQAGDCGVQQINLSGGETMVYPHVYKLVEKCTRSNLRSAIALSGYGFGEKELERFKEVGLTNIHVSLNGSTEEINKKTRDGYKYAISTLKLLQEKEFPTYIVNWVAHKNNIEDFPKLVELCEEYGVHKIDIIMLKPDSSNSMEEVPTRQQLLDLGTFIKKTYKGNIEIRIEGCFSQLRAHISNGFLMNTNIGIGRGCGAGRDGISLSVNGKFTPCRHLEIEEDFDTIEEYWNKSLVLKELRTVHENPEEPCSSCRYSKNCLHCIAINYKTNDKLAIGGIQCNLYFEKKI